MMNSKLHICMCGKMGTILYNSMQDVERCLLDHSCSSTGQKLIRYISKILKLECLLQAIRAVHCGLAMPITPQERRPPAWPVVLLSGNPPLPKSSSPSCT